MPFQNRIDTTLYLILYFYLARGVLAEVVPVIVLDNILKVFKRHFCFFTSVPMSTDKQRLDFYRDGKGDADKKVSFLEMQKKGVGASMP